MALPFRIAVTIIIGLCTFVPIVHSGICPSLHADFMRRQVGAPWNRTLPYNETNGEKHTPYIAINGSLAIVKVGNGSPFHPMAGSASFSDNPHFITHIYAMNQVGEIVAMIALDPVRDNIPEFAFVIPAGTTKVKAFSFCNLHGLWEGPTVNATPGLDSEECSLAQTASTAWTSIVADFRLQQSLPPHSQFGGWPYATQNRGHSNMDYHGLKHTPYIIVINASEGKVKVGGRRTIPHPVTASNQSNVVHFITHIYVLDQNEKLVTMQTLDPTSLDAATINFAIPAGATKLTAYAWCNRHGLWTGPISYLTMRQFPIIATQDGNNQAVMIVLISAVILLTALLTSIWVLNLRRQKNGQKKQTDSNDLPSVDQSAIEAKDLSPLSASTKAPSDGQAVLSEVSADEVAAISPQAHSDLEVGAYLQK